MNAVHPGFVRTALVAGSMAHLAEREGVSLEAAYALSAAHVPLRRVCTERRMQDRAGYRDYQRRVAFSFPRPPRPTPKSPGSACSGSTAPTRGVNRPKWRLRSSAPRPVHRDDDARVTTID